MIPDGPRNVVISPAIVHVTPDDVLNCAADANPPVEYYTWSDINNPQAKILKEGADASSITLSSDFLERRRVMIVCTVRNTLSNQETRESSGHHSFQMVGEY